MNSLLFTIFTHRHNRKQAELAPQTTLMHPPVIYLLEMSHNPTEAKQKQINKWIIIIEWEDNH